MSINLDIHPGWAFGLLGIGYIVLATYVAFGPHRGNSRLALLVAFIASALNAQVYFSISSNERALLSLGQIADIIRISGWYGFLLIYLSIQLRGAVQSVKLTWLVSTATYLLVIGYVSQWMAQTQVTSIGDPVRLSLLISLLMPVFGVLLVEHVIASVPREAIRSVDILLFGLGIGFLFDIYVYGQALVHNHIDAEAAGVRGVVNLMTYPLIATAVGSRDPAFGGHPSKTATAYFGAMTLIELSLMYWIASEYSGEALVKGGFGGYQTAIFLCGALLLGFGLGFNAVKEWFSNMAADAVADTGHPTASGENWRQDSVAPAVAGTSTGFINSALSLEEGLSSMVGTAVQFDSGSGSESFVNSGELASPGGSYASAAPPEPNTQVLPQQTAEGVDGTPDGVPPYKDAA